MSPAKGLGERGSAVLEVVLLAPVVVGMLLLVVFGGRVAVTHQLVQSAAADAARAASLARTAGLAHQAATTAAATALANQAVTCTRTSVTVDVTGFAKPVGAPALVKVTVDCEVPTADLSLPGMPGSLPVEATMTSPLDVFRGRR